MSEETVSLSALKAILAEQARINAENTQKLIAELRKPTVMEQKELDREAKELESRNQERKDNAAGILQQMEYKKANQRACSHLHRDGNSHCVYIMEKPPSPGYILCQKHQCKIRPGVEPENYKGTDIYDTVMFNRMFQTLPSNELFQ